MIAADVPEDVRTICAKEAAQWLGIPRATFHRWADRHKWVKVDTGQRGRREYLLWSVMATLHPDILDDPGDE